MKRGLALALALLLAIGAFALVLVLSDAGVKDVFAGLAAAGWPALGVMLGLGFLQLLAQAWSWQLLLAGTNSHPVRFRDVLGGVTVGWAGNFLTPSMYLGGEAVRILYLARRSGLERRAAVASVLISKYLELTTFLLFLLGSTAALIYGWRARVPSWVLGAVIGCDAALVAAFLVFYVSVAERWGLIVRFMDRLGAWGILAGWMARHRRKVLEVEAMVHRAFHRDLAATLRSLAAMALFTAVVFLRPVAFFAFLRGGWPFSLAELALLFVLVQLLQALQLTPGGLGFLEGGVPAIFLLVGVPAPQALGFTAFLRVTDLALLAAGLGLLTYEGLQLAGEGSANDEEALAGEEQARR